MILMLIDEINAIKEIHYFQSSTELILSEITLSCHQEHKYHWQYTVIELLQKTAEAILCTLFKCKLLLAMASIIILINADDMKLVLGISAMTRSNYFYLINVSDHPISTVPASAATIHCLHSVSALPTTPATASLLLLSLTTISLFPTGADRVSACQMADIRGPKKKKKKKKKKKRDKKKKREKKKEKENNDNDKNNNNSKNDNNNENDKLVI
ncbi:conserved hypothetical protein [Coccidioides posadasii str. Silveira]|uniref:Uncharacterized protein n=1 Tax=Coccidioides posadasii (strain RMSCC 757 / Silveira) TaxID=443226 RepID=E9DH42_COCPS|nr:conserved hypothetical protein [Coccidioides posadasii str. Silveira]